MMCRSPSEVSLSIVVMNAPDGNTITTAEHTMALLIALARRVPQANSSLRAGKWERKKFIGVELQGKTLGVLGLGRIGRTVAVRAHAFGMNIVAFDPFIAPDQARDLGIEVVPFDDVLARLKQVFQKVNVKKPAASRGESAETGGDSPLSGDAAPREWPGKSVTPAPPAAVAWKAAGGR